MTLEQLEKAVLERPLAERALLAEKLLATLDEDESNVSQAWIEEVKKRREDFLNGTARFLSKADFEKLAAKRLQA